MCSQKLAINSPSKLGHFPGGFQVDKLRKS